MQRQAIHGIYHYITGCTDLRPVAPATMASVFVQAKYRDAPVVSSKASCPCNVVPWLPFLCEVEQQKEAGLELPLGCGSSGPAAGLQCVWLPLSSVGLVVSGLHLQRSLGPLQCFLRSKFICKKNISFLYRTFTNTSQHFTKLQRHACRGKPSMASTATLTVALALGL